MKFDSKRACDAHEKDVREWLPDVNGYMLLAYPVSFTDHKITGGCSAQPVDSPTFTFADSLSWTRGSHVFKGGAEVRRSRSTAPDATNWIPTATGGSAQTERPSYDRH